MKNSETDPAPEYLKTHTLRLCQNLVRVDSLVDLHSFASGLLDQHRNLQKEFSRGSKDELPKVDDVLRAATVLLHASLEDFLRTIAAKHLPRKETELLKQVPLAGGRNPHQTKYTLSDLTVHSGKDIDTIIDDSIQQWLQQQSFNNCADISGILKHLGIDPESCNAEFAVLDEMIARRHRIVHNADRSIESSSDDSGEPVSLSVEKVQEWRSAVQRFMNAALYRLNLVVEGEAAATE